MSLMMSVIKIAIIQVQKISMVIQEILFVRQNVLMIFFIMKIILALMKENVRINFIISPKKSIV